MGKENKIIEKLCTKDKYLHIHLGALLVFFLVSTVTSAPTQCYYKLNTLDKGLMIKEVHYSTHINTHTHFTLFTQPKKKSLHSKCRPQYMFPDQRIWYKKNF